MWTVAFPVDYDIGNFDASGSGNLDNRGFVLPEGAKNKKRQASQSELMFRGQPGRDAKCIGSIANAFLEGHLVRPQGSMTTCIVPRTKSGKQAQTGLSAPRCDAISIPACGFPYTPSPLEPLRSPPGFR